jgi:hypothetical protein
MRTSGHTNSGQSLATLDDHALLELLLRDDLPRYLNDRYAGEADRRMQQPMGQMELAI